LLVVILLPISMFAQKITDCDQTTMESDIKTGTIKFSSPTYREMTIKKYIKGGEVHYFLKLEHKAFIPQFGDNNVKILLKNGEALVLDLVTEEISKYDSDATDKDHFFYLSLSQLKKLAEFEIIIIRLGVTEISAQLNKFKYYAACLLQ